LRAAYPTFLASLMLVLAWPGLTFGENESNRHHIEVIVFQQTDLFGAERTATDPELAYQEPLRLLGHSQTLYPPVPDNASDIERLASLMVPARFLTRERATAAENYVALGKSAHQLNAEAFTLERNGAYRVLFHQAWEQPLTSRKDAQWVAIAGGNRFADHSELEGSIGVYQSRFIHVEAFLWLSQVAAEKPFEADPAEQASLPLPSGDDKIRFPQPITLPPAPTQSISPELSRLQMIAKDALILAQDDTEPVETMTPAFSVAAIDILKTSDQIRRKTLHYIDHPRMGILVMVSPVGDDQDPEDEDFELNPE
jgi:Peptidoglycan-binding protein, CsiV